MNLSETRVLQLTAVTMDGRSLTIAGVYGILFIVGTYGNVSVVSCIHFIQKRTESKRKISSNKFIRTERQRKNVFIYVTALCCVDMAVMLSIPITIASILFGTWVFGTVVCRLHLLWEPLTKALSTILLTVIAFDRYQAVCRPNNGDKSPGHHWKPSLFAILGSTVVALVALAPLPYYAVVLTIVSLKTEMSKLQIILHVKKDACYDGMGANLRSAFAAYTFAVGFCLPACLMTFFYTRILLKLHRHKERSSACHSHQESNEIYRGCNLFLFLLPNALLECGHLPDFRHE